MAPVHKAIETRYAGCHFRSRLEARWAVFFDALEIRWDYEPEGVEISGCYGPQRRYLPDFWLPDLKCWVEVKGDWSAVSPDYWKMLADGMDWGGPLADGVLLLGPIPRGSVPWSRGDRNFWAPLHTLLYADKGVIAEGVEFSYTPSKGGSLRESGRLRGLDWKQAQRKSKFCDDYGFYYDSSCGDTGDLIRDEVGGNELWYQKMHQDPKGYHMPGRIQAAYDAARSARFEHGQNGSR
jgi:hypothetical protein